MTQGRLGFEFDAAPKMDEKVTAWSGLPVLVEAMTALGVDASIRKHLKVFRGRREFDELKLVRSLVLLNAAGGDCLDDIRMLRDDKALAHLIGHAFPSPETLREFLYRFHEDALIEAARTNLPANRKSYVPDENAALRGLGQVVADLVGAFQRRWPQRVATVDIDATFQESHKQQAKDHYESGPGYAPMVATWVEQRLVVSDEFRDGNVAPHYDALGVAQRAFAAIPEDVQVRRMRADTAAYSVPLLRWLCGERIEFAIGAQMREGLRDICEAVPADGWKFLDSRPDSTLHISEVTYAPKDWHQRDPKLRYIAIRMTPRQSELFDEQRTVKYLAVVTNSSKQPSDVVHWYWAKGGTIEHVHDVLKNELAAGVLPCGRFGANAAWFRAAVLTYNVLRVLQATGPTELANARPKRLRLNLLALPAVVVKHARKTLARVAASAAHLVDCRNAIWLGLASTA